MRRTALIVDDHARFRRSARTLLELEGFEVIGEAADGASALELAAQLDPELVLLDVGLPDQSGLDIASELAASSDAAVVLVSSRSARDVGPRLAASGALGFIPKDELSAEAIAAVIGGRR